MNLDKLWAKAPSDLSHDDVYYPDGRASGHWANPRDSWNHGPKYNPNEDGNDGIGDGDYVFVFEYSSLWLVAVALCTVVTAVVALMVCQRASATRKVVYRKVQVIDSDSEMESKRLKEIHRV